MPMPTRVHVVNHANADEQESDAHHLSAEPHSASSLSRSRSRSRTRTPTPERSVSRSRSRSPSVARVPDILDLLDILDFSSSDEEDEPAAVNSSATAVWDALLAVPFASWPAVQRRIAYHLIDADNNNWNDAAAPMTAEFRSAITEIFHRYASIDNPLAPSAPHRTMSKDDMRRYIASCGASMTSRSDERLEHIFTHFPPNQEWNNFEQLTCEGFCSFYREACCDRIFNVWSDLKINGFYSDIQVIHDEDMFPPQLGAAPDEQQDDEEEAGNLFVDEPPPVA